MLTQINVTPPNAESAPMFVGMVIAAAIAIMIAWHFYLKPQYKQRRKDLTDIYNDKKQH